MIFRIALRNLLEHRSKSFIVGGLIAVGVFLLVVGNSVMDSVSEGIRRSFTEQYSGDLFLHAPSENEASLSIFGSPEDMGMNKMIGLADKLEEVRQLDNIAMASAQTVGVGTMEGPEGNQIVSFYWGVDPEVWDPNFGQFLTWVEGGFWSDDQTGVVLSKPQADSFNDSQKQALALGDPILITQFTADGRVVIREVPLRGIYEFDTIVTPVLDMMGMVDLRSTQALLGLDQQFTTQIALDADEEALLGDLGEDDLFADDGLGLFGGDGLVSDTADTEFDMLALDEELSTSLERRSYDQTLYVPEYQFVTLLLEDPSKIKQTQAELEQWIKDQGLDWKVGDWRVASGFLAELADGIKVGLNGLVMLLTVVAMLIIMNTLVISVTERMQEIGTMRAIGAQKSFVRGMVLSETLVLALMASLVGIIVASVAVLVMNQVGIPAGNEFLAILFGGEQLRPDLSIGSMFQSIIVMSLGALIACLYPLRVALKVSPLKAMQG